MNLATLGKDGTPMFPELHAAYVDAIVRSGTGIVLSDEMLAANFAKRPNSLGSNGRAGPNDEKYEFMHVTTRSEDGSPLVVKGVHLTNLKKDNLSPRDIVKVWY